ncbi:MAG: glucokinase [Nitrosomonas sp.]|jgi:glucokinase|nr:glucokinase [Nitrosomonas sp.]MBK7363517.1 glucokinase [Nitrosomonas sp.]
MDPRFIIYGDIGGTKTILRLARVQNDDLSLVQEQRYTSQAYQHLDEIISDFLANQPDAGAVSKAISVACFAIAGPIVEQQARLTNLPWLINAADLSQRFTIPQVKLINDFEATALGVEKLTQQDLEVLQIGKESKTGMRVVLGAGTGMGVAWIAHIGCRYIPIPTEAGHIDFAPTSDLQIELLNFLSTKFGHVSIERVLSGPGLTNIFNFLQQRANRLQPSSLLELGEDEGQLIIQLALEQSHDSAIESLQLFTEIYGAFAGNLALAGLCRGGVYIAGGIAPRIIHYLKIGRFIQAFHSKGRFAGLMHEIPLSVILNTQVGLLGAESEAQRLLRNDLSDTSRS